MKEFSLTIRQLNNIIKEAERDNDQEDILCFKINNDRLTVSQYDWGHTGKKILMDKPC